MLGYTNHTLLPEALERWSTWLMGNVLPRHMQLIEMIDARACARPTRSGPRASSIVRNNEVHMGELAFIMAHKVNGVSALHTELIKTQLFPDLHKLHPEPDHQPDQRRHPAALAEAGQPRPRRT